MQRTEKPRGWANLEEGTGVGCRGGTAWKRRWDLGAEGTGPIGTKQAGPEAGEDESSMVLSRDQQS